VLNDSIFNVITPAATQDLTTLETVKDELSITGNDSDVRLTRWIRESSGYIANWCNRVFGAEQVSEQWRGSDRWSIRDSSTVPRPLQLRRYPIVRIDSITEQDDPVLAATAYEFEAATGLLWRLTELTSDTGVTTSGTRIHWYAETLRVVYSGGYDVPRNEPYQLEQACLMLIKNRQDTISRDRMLRSQNIPGVLEEQWWNPAMPGQPGMPPDVAELLTPFRNYNA
jgi:hypothetical protein